MNIKFNGNINDISMILVSSVRYALGRKTYIVGWTKEIVKKNLHLLTEKDREVMIRDITEHEIWGYGDDCDTKDWMDLLEILTNKE